MSCTCVTCRCNSLHNAYGVYRGSVICVQLIHSSRSSENQHVSCIVAVGLFDGILVICRQSCMGVRCHSVRLDSGSNVSMSIFSKDNFTQ